MSFLDNLYRHKDFCGSDKVQMSFRTEASVLMRFLHYYLKGKLGVTDTDLEPAIGTQMKLFSMSAGMCPSRISIPIVN